MKRSAKGNVEEAPQPYATPYHTPVLCKEVCLHLIGDPNGIYVDGTLGGGGHTAALLDQLASGARVIGIDQDQEALRVAGERLKHDTRFTPLYGNFGHLKALLQQLEIDTVDGILLDLGVSSHQLDNRSRGFSFQGAGPLDMRMDSQTGMPASALINHLDEQALRRIIWTFGEEKRAVTIVRNMLKKRPFETTEAFADCIREVVKGPEQHKTLARVFQAFRIAVNEELTVLEDVLRATLTLVKPGGKLAVITYHSLEDRPVKRFLKFGNFEGVPYKDFFGNLITPWQLILPKAIEATENEIFTNPRARSAKLRIATRTETPSA
ncbi:MAG: 16S rRNA (cytosine(1402)-N(4))-methyltransferase RsmH [Bacteroidetes Order II. Incertae sedis bacterium]|nr:16S rRNA (cytosine(1402)-N(4))-methyltransferase RsmH [Bacteroidetes Order II. bacterium]